MRRRKESESFWERDRRTGRLLGIAWFLIGLSFLLVYAAVVKAVLFG